MKFTLVRLSSSGSLLSTAKKTAAPPKRNSLVAEFSQALKKMPDGFELNVGDYQAMWVRQTRLAGVCTLTRGTQLVSAAAFMTGLDAAGDDQAETFVTDLITETAARHETALVPGSSRLHPPTPALLVADWEDKAASSTLPESSRILVALASAFFAATDGLS